MKNKNSRRLVRWGLGALLCCGVSQYALYEKIKTNVAEFAQSKVVLQDKEMSAFDFYKGLVYEKNMWWYVDENGKKINVDSETNFDKWNKGRRKWYQQVAKERKVEIDTVFYYKVKNDKWRDKATKDSLFLYDTKTGTYDVLPQRGANELKKMTIRHFEPKDGKHDKSIELHNDEYNKTSVHEGGHFEDQLAGVGEIGQSYELSFVETCLDEVKANISQVLAKRRSFLQKGRNFDYFSGEFEFYGNAVKAGKINPQNPDYISEEEKEFIAINTFRMWMDKKFDLYYKKNMNRTLAFHSREYSNWNSVQEDTVKHKKVLRGMFTFKDKEGKMDPIDLSSYMLELEHEILERIKPENKEIFAQKVAEKKAKESHLDKLERLRRQEGRKAYDDYIEAKSGKAKLTAVLQKFCLFKSR